MRHPVQRKLDEEEVPENVQLLSLISYFTTYAKRMQFEMDNLEMMLVIHCEANYKNNIDVQ